LIIFVAQIGEVSPPLAYQFEQASAGMLVVFVYLQVLDELVDAGCEQGYLDLR